MVSNDIWNSDHVSFPKKRPHASLEKEISSKIYRIFDSSFTMVLWYKFIEIHKKIATLDLGKRLRIEWLMPYNLRMLET